MTQMIIAPVRIIASLPRGEGVICGEIDLQHLNDIRRRMPVAGHRRFAPVEQILPVKEQ